MKDTIRVRYLSALSILLFLLHSMLPLSARGDVRDSPLQSAIDSAGLKYEITKDGFFKIILRFDDGRSQIVLVNSQTQKVNALEMREIYAFAYKSKGEIPVNIANKLLADSQNRIIGAWETISDRSSNLSLAVFNAKIPANIAPEDLINVIRLVGVRADEMEKELTQTDEF